MRIPRLVLGWLLLSHGGLRLCAADTTAAPTVQWSCLGLHPSESDSAKPALESPPLHVFGDGPLTFDLAVDAPLGTRLTVVADLVQTAGSIATPLQKSVSVCPELVFDTRTHLVATCSFPALPAVERATRLLLTLRTGPEAADSVRKLVLPVVVYPREGPDEWKKTLAARLTRSGLQRMAIFGAGRALRQFLRARQVVFEDLGKDWPAEPDPRTLYIGETPTPAPPRFNEARDLRLVLFLTNPGDPMLPGVFQTVDARGDLWKVTLPDLLDHPSQDPRAQATLAEIFRQALEPRPTSFTETNP